MPQPSSSGTILTRTLLGMFLFCACFATRSQETEQERDPAVVSARFEGWTLDDLRELAGKGDAVAQYHLGKTLTRRGEFEEGYKWTRESAMQGLALGQYNHHVNYFHGQGVGRDMDQAFHWLRLAADAGHAVGQYTLAEHFRKGDVFDADQAAAAKYYRMAAERGHTLAQYRLARLLESGTGIERSETESAGWMTRSADGGDRRAQSAIGYRLQTGKGVRKDLERAFHYYSLAAEQGYTYAMYQVGRMLTYGHGTAKDHPAGIRWLTAAADEGYEESMFLLGWLAEHERDSLGLTIAPNYKVAQEWYEQAARHGHVQGMMRLGLILTSGGLGDERRISGIEWLKRSAEAGEADAAHELGSILLMNRSWIRQDHGEAARWFESAAKAGNGQARLELGRLLLRGDGVEHDQEIARNWLMHARDSGSSEAALELGSIEGVDAAEMFRAHSREELGRHEPASAPALRKLAGAFESGIGGPRDLQAAARLYARDAQYKALDPAHDVDRLARLVALEGVRHDESLERSLPDPHNLHVIIRKFDAMITNPETMFLLGRLYFEGLGVGEDRAQGVRWFLRAAQGGHAEAMTAIGRLWAEGEAGTADPMEAERWFREAIASGSQDARRELGSLLFVNPERRPEGAAWLRLASSPKGGASPEAISTVATQLSPDEETETQRWIDRISNMRADSEKAPSAASPQSPRPISTVP